jgi:hypothetical protein
MSKSEGPEIPQGTQVPELNDVLDSTMARALGRSESPVVPPGLSDAVMTEVRSIDAGFGRVERWHRAARTLAIVNPRNVTVRVRLMFAVAGVLSLAAVVFVVWGLPPSGAGRHGTIGPAGVSMTATSPPGPTDPASEAAGLQRFLQSDAWSRLMMRPSMRTELGKIFANPALTAAIANPVVLHALSEPAVARVIGNPANQASLTNPGFAQTLGDPGAEAALSDPAFGTALRNPAFRAALLDPAFEAVLLDPDFEAALEDKAFQAAFGQAVLEATLESAIAAAR